MNKKCILLNAPSGMGKTSALRNLDFSKYIYLNLDGKSELPFGGEDEFFKFITPERGIDVIASLEALEESEAEGIIVDTLSFLVMMLEQELVLDEDNGYQGWADYAEALKKILVFANNKSKKNWIFLSHTQEGVNNNTQAFCKGSVKNISIEAWFSTVLELYTYDLAEPNVFGSVIGYGFLTKKTIDNRKTSAKSPIGMFPKDGRIRNNDLDLVLRRLSGEKIDWDNDEVIFAKDKELAEKLGI